MNLDPDFAVVAAGVALTLVVGFFFLRWRARCPTCGAWGQTLSCEKCGAVNDPYAPTGPAPTLPTMRSRDEVPRARAERPRETTQSPREQRTGEVVDFKTFKDLFEKKGLKGLEEGFKKVQTAKTPEEARAVFLEQVKPFLPLVEKAHVYVAALIAFIFVNSLPGVSAKVALIAAVAVGFAVRKAKGKTK